ncbi:membrane bound O-acyl transferase family protein [Rhizoctonia solani]|uniref:Membrane bound O-acyl transferase family protein n=1 Tax=Rhizoctonia solani TaxID=456999 RepID=A0A8H8P1F1_9AGAM|nr:membrane bound O-acyl transferase family protein [Rhizoctonia solani]QRW23315.1 membrane bound O-acyl transferase family protein [Rhizoctonia solani]
MKLAAIVTLKHPLKRIPYNPLPTISHIPPIPTQRNHGHHCSWHSVLRYGFCSTGGKLGWEIGGSTGAILGVFLVSGLLHDFGLWCMGQGMELSRVTMYFVLQGVIVLLEKTFEVDIWFEAVELEDADKYNFKATITGLPKQPRVPRKNSLIDNGLGQLWTVFWIVVPATLMMDAGARRGFFGIPFDLSSWI